MSGTYTLRRQTLIRAIVVLALLSGVVTGSRVLARSDDFAIAWWTIGSGGGTSRDASGRFAIAGTIGQAQAGTVSGGNYAIDSGFWYAAGMNQSQPTMQQYLPTIQR